MQVVELLNQFLAYTLLWISLIPLIYILSSKTKATLLDGLIFIIGSTALSFLLIIFTYTLLTGVGVIALLASISSLLVNILIMIIIMLAPVVVVAGHYKLEHYNRENREDS